MLYFYFFKQKTSYMVRISEWSSDVCSSDLLVDGGLAELRLKSELLARDPLPRQIVLYCRGHTLPGVHSAPGPGSRRPSTRRRRLLGKYRSEARRGGKECVSTCTSRCEPFH